MRLLLDTHTLIWLLNGDSTLSSGARAAIFDRGNEKLLSIGSLWEIAIKTGLGKLTVGQPLVEFFTRTEQAGTIRSLPSNRATCCNWLRCLIITATRLTACSSRRHFVKIAR